MFQIPRACGLNYICKITHVTQINVKWFVFIFSAIKCRFKRVPVDFGPALEFRLTRRRSLSRFIGREDKFSYSRKILTVKCLFHPCCSLFLFFSPLMFIEFWGFIQQRPIYLMQEYAFSIPKVANLPARVKTDSRLLTYVRRLNSRYEAKIKG